MRELRGAAGGLSARAARALRRARPGRAGRAAGLRQRRHLPCRPGDLPAAGREGDRARRCAGRPQHQRGLRLDPRRASSPSGCLKAGHAVGFAFDGDGDRVLAVDRAGQVVDGDELMALVALHLQRTGRLPGEGVVVTVMTNYGFHTAMERPGSRWPSHRSATATSLRSCAPAAGCSAGSSRATSSRWASTAQATASPARCLPGGLGGRALAEREAMQKLPQRLVNVRVRDREALRARCRRSRRPCEQPIGAGGPWAGARAPQRHRAAGACDGRGAHRQEAEEVCSRLVELVRARARLVASVESGTLLSSSGRSRGSAFGAPALATATVAKGSAPVCGIVGYVGRRPAQEILLEGCASSSIAAMTRLASR